MTSRDQAADYPIVTALNYYPVKSCMGIDLKTAIVEERGIKDDRGWMLVGVDNVALTQRDLPAMVHISAEIVALNNGAAGAGRALLLRAPGMVDLVVPEVDSECSGASDSGEGDEKHKRLVVSIWDDPNQAIDQGTEAAQWLSEYLKKETRLVRMSADNQRNVPLKREESFKGVVGFADIYPFLVISQESLDDLNGRLAVPVPMNRFRPNIVVSGVEPFAEDTWTHIRIGDIELTLDKPCARCVIVTIDQKTGVVNPKEPLATLSKYRREADKVMFGQNAVHNRAGVINVGDRVEILKVR